MTNKQKCEIRQSEIRQRLQALSTPGESLSDSDKTEIDTLFKEMSELEVKYRAAVASEAREATEVKRADTKLDGLRARATLSEYMRHAVAGTGLEGACRELNEELGIKPIASLGGGTLMPIESLLQLRTNDTTQTQAADETNRAPIMRRLFGSSVLDALGVRLDSVGIGSREYPLITAGPTPAAVAEGADVSVTDTTLTSETLKPKRLGVAYEFTAEASALVVGLESALAADVRASTSAEMSKLVLTGDGTGVNVRGFDTAINFAGITSPSDEVTFSTAIDLGLDQIDGLHGSSEADVSLVMAPDSYRKIANMFATGTATSVWDIKRSRGTTILVSANVAAAVAGISQVYVHAGRDMGRGDSIAAVWPIVEIIRDPYTKARSATTVITFNFLWDAYCGFRAMSYGGSKIKLTA